MTARVFISVAEESADMHAAALMRAARRLLPGCRFYGLTGPRMRAEGAETVYDFAAHAAMLTGVFSVIGHARAALRRVRADWERQPPDLVLLLDSPELNLRLAHVARRRGLPVLYYIAPQTWAAREYRNRRIARDVNLLACILPFEQDYFRRHGILADFVGHPLFETLADCRPDPAKVESLRSGDGPLVALLPGSRRHVIEAMLPRQLEVLGRLRARRAGVRAAVSCVSPDRLELVRSLVSASGLEVEVVVADNASLLSAADLVLVASGTATLEVAHYGKPMVVLYDAGRLLAGPYRLFGRRFLKVRHLSLVNLLAGARVVPEFMPFLPDTRPVAEVAGRLLEDHDWRDVMIRRLESVVAPLRGSRASERVCEWMARLLRGRRSAR